MRYLTWILTVPLAALVVIFAVNNRSPVTIDLWPFDARLDMPLFLPIDTGFIVGVLFGGFVLWVGAASRRRAWRRTRRRVAALEEEVARFKAGTMHTMPAQRNAPAKALATRED